MSMDIGRRLDSPELSAEIKVASQHLGSWSDGIVLGCGILSISFVGLGMLANLRGADHADSNGIVLCLAVGALFGLMGLLWRCIQTSARANMQLLLAIARQTGAQPPV